MALTDDSGAVKTTYVYDALGNATVSGETTDNPFQFAGRENDETGLLHERNRYYSFEMQRYIKEDPIRLRGGDINFYVRTSNAPVNKIDPLGLWSVTLEGYLPGIGWGGGITFGQNPGPHPYGAGFMSIRAGYGYGATAAWDPNGTRAGGTPCDRSMGLGLGAYGNAGLGAGVTNLGVSYSAGVNLMNGQLFSGSTYPSPGLYSFGFSSGAGVEVTLW